MKNNLFYKIAHASIFKYSIVGVIIFAAALVGFETYPNLYKQYHDLFKTIDYILQAIFTVEIIIRILAYGRHPLSFFKSAINVTDFFITALFYVPFGGAYASVLRLVRIIRVLRLITAFPELQIIVGALIKSIPSLGHITLLLVIQFYIFAILGNFLFGHHDVAHFGNVGNSMFTLFQVITLEGWVDILKAQQGGPIVYIYFISFILLGTMIVLNLFIGVILNGFDEVKKELEEEIGKKNKKRSLKYEIAQVSDQLNAIQQQLNSLNKPLRKKK